jgi:hypothetical protein
MDFIEDQEWHFCPRLHADTYIRFFQDSPEGVTYSRRMWIEQLFAGLEDGGFHLSQWSVQVEKSVITIKRPCVRCG